MSMSFTLNTLNQQSANQPQSLEKSQTIPTQQKENEILSIEINVPLRLPEGFNILSQAEAELLFSPIKIREPTADIIPKYSGGGKMMKNARKLHSTATYQPRRLNKAPKQKTIDEEPIPVYEPRFEDGIEMYVPRYHNGKLRPGAPASPEK